MTARQLTCFLTHAPRRLHWLAVVETRTHGACMYVLGGIVPLSMHEGEYPAVSHWTCRISPLGRLGGTKRSERKIGDLGKFGQGSSQLDPDLD